MSSRKATLAGFGRSNKILEQLLAVSSLREPRSPSEGQRFLLSRTQCLIMTRFVNHRVTVGMEVNAVDMVEEISIHFRLPT